MLCFKKNIVLCSVDPSHGAYGCKGFHRGVVVVARYTCAIHRENARLQHTTKQQGAATPQGLNSLKFLNRVS